MPSKTVTADVAVLDPETGAQMNAFTGDVITADEATPDPSLTARLVEQESIVISDIQSFVQRTSEVQARVGRALNVIRAHNLWKVSRNEIGKPFGSFSAYLENLAERSGYTRTNFLRMAKADAPAYLYSGDAPDGFKVPTSRGGASGVKYTSIDKAADITLRQVDALFERWAARAALVRREVDGEDVEDGTLLTLLVQAQEAMATVRSELEALSAVE